jgi:hypothetical protein
MIPEEIEKMYLTPDAAQPRHGMGATNYRMGKSSSELKS